MVILDLTLEEQDLISRLPTSGSTISTANLREQLKWERADFDVTIWLLKEEGWIESKMGLYGGISRNLSLRRHSPTGAAPSSEQSPRSGLARSR